MTSTVRDPTLRSEDAASRALAQTCFDRPLVLEAGAGTGKTTALVSRMVVWALGEGWIRATERITASEGAARATPDRVAARTLQRIVAITFTEAAAAEMARRAGETLARIATGESLEALAASMGLYGPALPTDGRVRRARARALVGALDRLTVRTIHAFARRLLAAHPVEARLHPAFEVDGEGRGAAEVVRDLLERRLRQGYGDPGDPVLLGLASCGIGAPELEEELLALLQAAIPPAWLEEDPFDTERVEALRRTLVAELEAAQSLVARLPRGTRATRALEFAAAARRVCNRLRRRARGGIEGIASLQAVVEEELGTRLALLDAWREPRFNQAEEAALGDIRDEVAALAGRLRARLRHLCELDAKCLDLGRRALGSLLAEASEELRLRGLLSYQDLLRAAADLLSRSEAVAAHEREQIDQLLVDEFQDTDALQCRMVASLALEGPRDLRPGLFLVGDPKQSIYGWRGADLAAYDAFVERVAAEGGLRRTLSVNRRSVQPVLDEVARAIRPLMHPARGVQPRFEPLLAYREKEPGFARDEREPVEYWVSRVFGSDATPDETRKPEATRLEARALANDIAHLVRRCGVAPRDVGILLRSFGDVEEYLSALRDVGVPYAVARDRSYYRRREIQDATCLVRCVIDPSDTLALVGFLRSSVGGVPDAALLPLWRERLPGLVARLPARAPETLAEIAGALARAAAAVPADVPGIEAMAGWENGLLFALEALCALRQSFEADASDVFVERLRGFLLFEASEAARPVGAFRLANLERFFRELGEALAGGEDPSAVLRHLRGSARDEIDAEEGRPLDAAEDAVQVMSIHKAKGLGFAHTYVMQLHKEPGGPRTGLPPRAVRVGRRVALRLFGERTPDFLEVETREREARAAEDVRTLYVAMTRAKERLVLAGLWPATRRRSASHVTMLEQREGGIPDLASLAGALGSKTDRVREKGALWVFPGLRDGADAASRDDGREPGVGEGALAKPPDGLQGPADALRLARAETDAARVAAARDAARLRMQRPFGGPASEASHEALREGFERRREAEPAGDGRSAPDASAARRVATVVGTAVHRALEGLDLALDPGEALAAAAHALDAVLVAQLAGKDLAAARKRAAEALGRFHASGLFAQLRRLAPHILARELPVLLAPDGGDAGPVGFVAGVVDLVYRDPGNGLPVVADYKTDRVADAEAMQALAARYAAQGAHYVRAVRQALALDRDPRFELWFLHAGKVAVAP